MNRKTHTFFTFKIYKIMRKYPYLSFLTLLLIITSCNPTDSNDIKDLQKEIIVNSSNQADRISTAEAGVVNIKEAPQEDPQITSTKNGATFKASTSTKPDIASNIPLVQVAEVSAPIYNSTTLRATHVAINGDYAYVSYNVEGSTYLGAIDVIDVSNPNNPSIVSGAIFPNTDISSIGYYNDALYIAGASSSLDNDGSNPAVLIQMELENGIPTDNLTLIDMPSYVATDVIANASGIYGVSGDTGVLAQYDLSNQSLKESVTVNDLRALGEYDTKIVVLSGTDGISVYNSTTLGEIRNFTTSEDIAASKRTIDFYNNNVFVAEGKKGLGIYNIENGNKLTTVDLPIVTDEAIDQNEVVTNAVTVENDHIFMANGAAGLAVHDLTDAISNISSIGTLEIDGSANYVKSANGYIFVASGDGGLKIIKTIDNSSSGSIISCTDLPAYTGGYWLNVNSNDSQAYSGSASLMGLNINAELTFCGSLAVRNGININSGGAFYMSGSLAQGSVKRPWNSINISKNATLYIEGSLVVFGNMILNNGATIEFLGSGSSITVHGKVIKNGTVNINGDFTDTNNKL